MENYNFEVRMNTLLDGHKTAEKTEDLHKIDIRCKIRELLETYAATETVLTIEELTEKVRLELEIEDEDLFHFAFIEAGNVLNQNAYEYVKQEDRIVLIPHCLRDAERCIAPIDEDGYHCQKCGACIISEITQAAEDRGIKWYMVGGGSHAIKVVKNARPRAVFGIACFDDAKLAVDKIGEYGIPTQAVLLSKAGCINTEVEIDRVLVKLDICDTSE
ncbi:MAG: DUF116 domain-containing protein [Candidatus Thorarchaeota archaeon]|nr:MAG: DUF116 domain-containing protein [Candidatus Thorarchaeota archaeon]